MHELALAKALSCPVPLPGTLSPAHRPLPLLPPWFCTMHPGRRHEAAKALFASMAAEGPAPDHTSYANIVRSYLNQAVGRHRQPQGSALSECVQGRGLHANARHLLSVCLSLLFWVGGLAAKVAASVCEAATPRPARSWHCADAPTH